MELSEVTLLVEAVGSGVDELLDVGCEVELVSCPAKLGLVVPGNTTSFEGAEAGSASVVEPALESGSLSAESMGFIELRASVTSYSLYPDDGVADVVVASVPEA